MLTYAEELPILPTKVLGSHGVPGWMWLVNDAVAAGTLGSCDLAEALHDAVDVALRDMIDAGVDIVSDGEFHRSDFTSNFHARIDGLEVIEQDRRVGYPGPDQIDAFRCVRELTVPGGFGLVSEVEHLRTRTQHPFITPLQGPLTQAFRIDPGTTYADKGAVAWALVPFINAELKAAVTAGARHVQIDEPAFWAIPGGIPAMVDLFNRCVDGVLATVELHLCFGNFRGRPATSDRSYRALAPYFSSFSADVIHLEFANRCMDEVELWAEHGGEKILCAGVIDVKGRSVEPPELVANRVRRLLRSVRPEKLWLAPDCGFSQTARMLAVEKLRSLVAGARIVRAELSA